MRILGVSNYLNERHAYQIGVMTGFPDQKTIVATFFASALTNKVSRDHKGLSEEYASSATLFADNFESTWF